jgi:hypothetical protein
MFTEWICFNLVTDPTSYHDSDNKQRFWGDRLTDIFLHRQSGYKIPLNSRQFYLER